MANALFKDATGDKPNTSAQIFFLKNRGGWQDKTEVDANISGDVLSITKVTCVFAVMPLSSS